MDRWYLGKWNHTIITFVGAPLMSHEASLSYPCRMIRLFQRFKHRAQKLVSTALWYQKEVVYLRVLLTWQIKVDGSWEIYRC